MTDAVTTIQSEMAAITASTSHNTSDSAGDSGHREDDRRRRHATTINTN
jgi:hypothetical protein